MEVCKQCLFLSVKYKSQWRIIFHFELLQFEFMFWEPKLNWYWYNAHISVFTWIQQCPPAHSHITWIYSGMVGDNVKYLAIVPSSPSLLSLINVLWNAMALNWIMAIRRGGYSVPIHQMKWPYMESQPHIGESGCLTRASHSGMYSVVNIETADPNEENERKYHFTNGRNASKWYTTE